MRGCGIRVAGGVYATTGLSQAGRPVEDFIFDPPQTTVEVEGEQVGIVEALGISPKGTSLFQDGGGVNHIVDWVGQEHYPNVSDFIEEVRCMGLSRRLKANLKWTDLSLNSRIILVHARAHIENAHDYFLAEDKHYQKYPNQRLYPRTCPRKRADHDVDRALDMCARLFWQDLDPETVEEVGLADFTGTPVERIRERKLPSFKYLAMMRPDGVTPRYAPAMFAVFPIQRLEVIADEDGAAERTAERICVAPYPVTIVEE